MQSFNCPPVLFLIFNRPDLTKRVFERIREAQPRQLFIAADGPRADRPGEAELCAETRAVVERVDWDCEVRTFFRDENLGCKHAVSSAITWFFEHVEEGIILEDDCLPELTFFRFCAELLNRYRNEERVMVISGNNFQNPTCIRPDSYYFSVYNHIWGWATWRHSWMKYDGNLASWPDRKSTSWLQRFLADSEAAQYWTQMFDSAHAGKIDSWGYPWTYSCWANDGLTVLPAVNLVTNIGFDDRATHTRDPHSPASALPTHVMEFPLRHPVEIEPDRRADRYTFEHLFAPPRSAPVQPSLYRRLRHNFLAFVPDPIRRQLSIIRSRRRSRGD